MNAGQNDRLGEIGQAPGAPSRNDSRATTDAILARMNRNILITLQDLIAAAARGDHSAFAQIYERTHLHLFGVAVRLLGNEQAAEDVLQEAYVSIWKNAASYRSSVEGQEIQPITWLIAIVRNKALDALRSRTRRSAHEQPQQPQQHFDAEDDIEVPQGTDTAPGALQLFEQAMQALRIEGCMAALDGSFRQSLALAYYQGLSHTEVAAQMNAPLGSVKAWIRRGLDKLRACLSAQGVTP
ncbi:RNA polymerase sigma-70 factor, ECF subfamily [Variovorax sp. 770b2]|nr:RNA polymerase sigma-70 factor, ECF subfamily [Variovorax sp. 770b2]